MPTTLTVTTDVGTFSRQTARPYTHVVVISDQRAEVLEARRLDAIASAERLALAYAAGTDGFGSPMDARSIADGSRDRWVQEYRAEAETLRAQGPITNDQPLAGGETWAASSWASRRDLAAQYAESPQLEVFRLVRIYEIATGRCVWATNRAVETPFAIQLRWAQERQARRTRRGRR